MQALNNEQCGVVAAGTVEKYEQVMGMVGIFSGSAMGLVVLTFIAMGLEAPSPEDFLTLKISTVVTLTAGILLTIDGTMRLDAMENN